MTDQNKGPWGSSGGEDTGGSSGDRRPASPWLPPSTGGEDQSRGPRRPSGFEEMMRRGRGPFGPQLPQLPGGRSLWGWVAAAVLGLWIASTSIWQVQPDEEGVVTRFGSYARTVGPGFNVTLPAPFERMQRVAVREIRTEDIPGGGANTENLVLTGDANIIDLSYSVRWTVKEPERFLFQLDNPEGTIRAVAESAMRATLANFTLVQAIGAGRTDIERQVQQRMQQILDRYRSGIRIEGVAVRNADPPNEVEEAFNNVNAARQRAESERNRARAYAEQVLRRAEGDVGEFNAVYAEYRLAPEVTRQRIYYDTMERILRQADKTIVEGGAGGVMPYLPLPEVRRRPPPQPAAPAATNAQPRTQGAQP